MSNFISRIENSLLIFSVSIMCLIAFSNVVSRYFLGASLAFTEEVTINLFVLMTFVGTSVGVRTNAHLGFTLIFDKAKLPVKKILSILIGAIVVICFLLFAYYGFKMVQFQMMINQTTPALGWQQWIFTLSFPVGCALCVIRAIESTVIEFKNLLQESE